MYLGMQIRITSCFQVVTKFNVFRRFLLLEKSIKVIERCNAWRILLPYRTIRPRKWYKNLVWWEITSLFCLPFNTTRTSVPFRKFYNLAINVGESVQSKLHTAYAWYLVWNLRGQVVLLSLQTKLLKNYRILTRVGTIEQHTVSLCEPDR